MYLEGQILSHYATLERRQVKCHSSHAPNSMHKLFFIIFRFKARRSMRISSKNGEFAESD